MIWQQNYNPVNNQLLSTALSILPIIILLGSLMILKMRAYIAAITALTSSLFLAIFVYSMPAQKAFISAIYGAGYGFLPIGWIVLNVIFLFNLIKEKGFITKLQKNLSKITQDRRLQLLLIAFCFGALMEGAAGFGTPVAITAAILISLNFPPLLASGLSLLANTAPVAYGGLGTPIVALQGVTGLDLMALSGMVGKQLAIFSILIPIWLICTFVGLKKTWEIMPAILVAGISFGITQLVVSIYMGPWLVGVIASIVSMGLTILFLNRWQPKRIFIFPNDKINTKKLNKIKFREFLDAWWPWGILLIVLLIWGLPIVKTIIDGLTVKIEVPFLNNLVYRMPPIVVKETPEPAIFNFNWHSATGTAIFFSALISGFILRYSIKEIGRMFIKSLGQVKYSLLTISSMMAIGFVTRYSGMDGTLGFAFSRTGFLYPFFGTLLGWLGVTMTGSDTSSNVLFGSLQKITSGQLGINPVIMASANSSGGVMGKMIDSQSIVVASTSTKWFGHESEILKFVFLHSLLLATLVGLEVMAQVYIFR